MFSILRHVLKLEANVKELLNPIRLLDTNAKKLLILISMSIEEENKLRDALKQNQTVVWAPDDETCRQVVTIGTHAEE